MIYFFTDFGFAGPYVGQMKSAFYEIAPDSVIIDLMHDAPKFDPKASAYILSALVDYLPQDSIIVGVVDPGVGNSSRRPIMIQADSYWFVGPDNGLFQHVVNKSITVNCYEIITDESISTSFHGRDVFAPAAAQLANYTVPVAKTINTNYEGYEYGPLFRYYLQTNNTLLPYISLDYIHSSGNYRRIHSRIIQEQSW